MIPMKDIQKWTGYIRGGCSPVGMKKSYPTFIDESALNLSQIVFSGGKIGVQIELSMDSCGMLREHYYCPLKKIKKPAQIYYENIFPKISCNFILRYGNIRTC
jgi:hypothetical protein